MERAPAGGVLSAHYCCMRTERRWPPPAPLANPLRSITCVDEIIDRKLRMTLTLSILELVRVTETVDARGALINARDLAAHAERLGYNRVGWPNITICAASPVPRPRLCWLRSPRARRQSVLVPAASCFPITRPMSSLNNSAPWHSFFRAGSTSGLAARRGPDQVDLAGAAALAGGGG